MAEPTQKADRSSKRLLEPSLFVGPPSQNASTNDIRPNTGHGHGHSRSTSHRRLPLPLLHREHKERPQTASDDPSSPNSPKGTLRSTVFSFPPRLGETRTKTTESFNFAEADDPPEKSNHIATQDYATNEKYLLHPKAATTGKPRRRGSAAAADALTDATWAEMQNTLSEVEHGASASSNVFSADHARALEELRTAQMALAQAWARSEADTGNVDAEALSSDAKRSRTNTEIDAASFLAGDRTAVLGAKTKGKKEVGGTDASFSGMGSVRSRAESIRSGRSQLEEETENDIVLARQRRQANDRYFERVNKGVVDVVARLEIVAKKMGGVEMESQEIWGSKSSVSSQSTA